MIRAKALEFEHAVKPSTLPTRSCWMIRPSADAWVTARTAAPQQPEDIRAAECADRQWQHRGVRLTLGGLRCVVMKLGRAIHSFFRRLFSEQAYYERLDTSERGRAPGRLRWFG